VYVVTTHHLKILLLLHAQAFINFGPVVYIKITGPNPIMVQVITVCTSYKHSSFCIHFCSMIFNHPFDLWNVMSLIMITGFTCMQMVFTVFLLVLEKCTRFLHALNYVSYDKFSYFRVYLLFISHLPNSDLIWASLYREREI
jgi:hypothetical protein